MLGPRGLWILLVAWACWGGPAFAGLVKGPYLQDLRPDGVVVAFETDTPMAGAVDYGPDDGYGTVQASSSTGIHHAVRLTGLPAATLFHYRVRLNGEPAGTPGTFVTAPDQEVPFSFLAYGDNRSDANAHALVVSRMLQYPASFVINTGDLVSTGSKEDQWQQFFEIEADLIRDVPLYVAIGNHETVAHQAPAPFLRLLVPPLGAESHPTYYSFDHANVHVVILDGFVETEASVDCFFLIRGFGECLNQGQVAWLEADLKVAAEDPAIDHVIVIAHEGPYSSKPGRTGSGHLRALLPLFAESKVSLILSGHDHYYEHGVSGNLVHYVITGGGGAPLYETVGPDAPVVYPHDVLVSTSVYNFVRVLVDGDRLEVTAFEADGTEIERFEIGPGRDCVTAEDCSDLAPGSCEGEWSCGRTGKCLWVCAKPPECSVPDDCLGNRDDRCPGAWDCIEGSCEWICDVTPDCTTDDDCKGRAGLTPCEGGHFACVNGMCEWTCPPPPADEVVRPPDTGPAPGDPGVRPPADTGAPPPDQGVPVTDEGGPPPSGGRGGCASPAARTGFPAVVLVLLLAGCLARLALASRSSGPREPLSGIRGRGRGRDRRVGSPAR